MGEKLQIDRNKQRFGFFDIEDAVTAILYLIDIDTFSWKNIYTVGNGKAYSVKDIVNSIKNVFDEVGLQFPETDIIQDEKACLTAVDYHQLKLDSGFKPKYSLEESIQRILSDYILN